MLAMTSGSAIPRAPRSGSLTSTSAAPPASAASASSGERTLTRSFAMVLQSVFHGKETHPARIAAESQQLGPDKNEAVQDRLLEPGWIIEVVAAILGECLPRPIGSTVSQLGSADDAAEQGSRLFQFRRHACPGS